MGTSNSERGARYKKRSKDWCAKHKYPCVDMELVRVVHTPNGVFPTKKDQLASDLLYLTKKHVVFLQVKGGGRSVAVLTKEAQDKFDNHSYNRSCRLELHIWRPRARAPEIIECRKTNVL